MSSNLDQIIEINDLLKVVIEKNASDLFITADRAPNIKVHGNLISIDSDTLTANQVKMLAFKLMNREQQKEFKDTLECNFALSIKDVGRFRVNVFQQRHNIGMVLRKIETKIPTPEELGLPDRVKDFVMEKRGLVLIVGATGMGKSSTVAALIGHRNMNSCGHIITIEDPIEYMYDHDGCVITQREVGVDTHSFEAALKNTLRQAPDVILIGEIRSRETMQHAITFAETGHLCMATLHANNANQALDRIINFFPEDRRDQLLLDLSFNLKAIVAQQLIPSPDHTRRLLAFELLLNTPLIAQTIRKGEMYKLKDIMTKSTLLGMQTFDQSLFTLYKDGKISYDDALHHADSQNELRLMIKLGEDGGLEKIHSALDELTLTDPFEEELERNKEKQEKQDKKTNKVKN